MSLEKITKYVEQIKVLEKELEQDKQVESTELNNQSDSYKAETYKLTDSIGKLSSQIKMVEDEIACNIQDAYIDKAYAELASEMKFWGINKPARKSTNSLQTLEERLKKLLIEKKHLEGDGRNKINESDSKIVSSIHTRHDEHKRKINDQIRQIISELKKEYNSLMQKSVKNYSAKDEPRNAPYVEPQIGIGNILTEAPEEMIKYGICNEKDLKFPYFFNLKSPKCNGNILINTQLSTLTPVEIEKILVALIFKYMENFPAFKFNIAICSSVYDDCDFMRGIFSPKMREEGVTISGDAIVDSSNELSDFFDLIRKTNIEIEDRIRANRCSNIFDLYEKGVTTESFRLIIVHSMFSRMSRENLYALQRCISSGKKCGTFFIIVDNFNLEDFDDKEIEVIKNIRESCQVISSTGNQFWVESVNEKFALEPVRLDDLVEPNDVYFFCEDYAKFIKEQKDATIPLEMLGFDQDWGEGSIDDTISIPVAYNAPVAWNLELNVKSPTPIASFIIGNSGVGKSTLLDNLILCGAKKYSPKELQFRILDFKDGSFSKKYLQGNRIPHVKAACQNPLSEEDADIFLSYILLENEKRNARFRDLSGEMGCDIADIVEYNRCIRQKNLNIELMPRLLLIVDECQKLFKDTTHSEICQDIIRRCRSTGIHFILSTQSMDRNIRDTFKFIDSIYCYRVSKDNAEFMFEDNREYIELAQKLEKYTAYASNNKGLTCYKIKNAYAGSGGGTTYAEKIRQRWDKDKIDVVEIGNKAPIYYRDLSNILHSEKDDLTLMLGLNYVDSSISSISLKQHLIMFGKKEIIEKTNNIWISLLKKTSRNSHKTFVVDASFGKSLIKHARKHIDSWENIHCFDADEYMDCLNQVNLIYQERVQSGDTEFSPVFLIINALQGINAIKANRQYQSASRTKETNFSLFSNPMDALLNAQSESSNDNFDTDSSSLQLSAKNSLFSMMENADDYNIHICISMEETNFTNSNGDVVLEHSHINQLKKFKHKIILRGARCENVLRDDLSYGQLLNSLNSNGGENLAIVYTDETVVEKVKYTQFD